MGGVAGAALPGVRRAHRIPGNVPLLSYVLLRVRCRNCKARISARYPLVEALTGILFAGAAYEFGLGLELLFALALVLALVALAGTDLEYQLLPNVIVGPAALVGVTLSVLQGPERWWVYLVSALAVAGGLFALVLAYPGGMGMGDVKMDGMLGAFLGPYAALAVFLGSPLQGDHRRTPHRRREDVMPARFAFRDLYGHRGYSHPPRRP